jgi:hypothetical protein
MFSEKYLTPRAQYTDALQHDCRDSGKTYVLEKPDSDDAV